MIIEPPIVLQSTAAILDYTFHRALHVAFGVALLGPYLPVTGAAAHDFGRAGRAVAWLADVGFAAGFSELPQRLHKGPCNRMRSLV